MIRIFIVVVVVVVVVVVLWWYVVVGHHVMDFTTQLAGASCSAVLPLSSSSPSRSSRNLCAGELKLSVGGHECDTVVVVVAGTYQTLVRSHKRFSIPNLEPTVQGCYKCELDSTQMQPSTHKLTLLLIIPTIT